jgi:hypothetical protein
MRIHFQSIQSKLVAFQVLPFQSDQPTDIHQTIIQLLPFQLRSANRPLQTRVSISQYQINEGSYGKREELFFRATNLLQLHIKESLLLNCTLYSVFVLIISTQVHVMDQGDCNGTRLQLCNKIHN